MGEETLNARAWKRRNNVRRVLARLRYPPPLYKRVGGIEAVVTHADGTETDLGIASDSYAKRWGVGSGQ